MNSHKVKIDGIDLGHAKIFIDGVQIPCRAINVDMAVDQAHSTTVTMENLLVPDIEIDSLVTFDFTPQTVEQALAVIKSTLNNRKPEECTDLLNQIRDTIDEVLGG